MKLNDDLNDLAREKIQSSHNKRKTDEGRKSPKNTLTLQQQRHKAHSSDCEPHDPAHRSICREEMDQTSTVRKPAYCQSDNETVHQVVSFYSVVMAVSQMTP